MKTLSISKTSRTNKSLITPSRHSSWSRSWKGRFSSTDRSVKTTRRPSIIKRDRKSNISEDGDHHTIFHKFIRQFYKTAITSIIIYEKIALTHPIVQHRPSKIREPSSERHIRSDNDSLSLGRPEPEIYLTTAARCRLQFERREKGS